MIQSRRNEYLIRDSILKLLSDEEIMAVSNAETRSPLADGDDTSISNGSKAASAAR